MKWAVDQRYKEALRRLLPSLTRDHVRKFRKLKGIAFLCGGASPQASRHELRSYLQDRYPNWMIFYADDIWLNLASRYGANALEAENWLARLSDAVIIIVESAGSIAELGAFALSEQLRKKLLVVIDRQYAADESFINSGPVAWVNKDSCYAPVIAAPFQAIGRAFAEVEDRIARYKPVSVQTPVNVLESPKHLLFTLCDLVAIFGPISAEALETLLTSVLGTASDTPIPLLLSFGTTMRLLARVDHEDEKFYIRRVADDTIQTFMRLKYFRIEPYRADFLGMMGRCDAFQHVLRAAAARAD